MIRNATTVVNMGCMDNYFCPTMYYTQSNRLENRRSKRKPIEKVREIRDEIERRVRELGTELNKQDI